MTSNSIPQSIPDGIQNPAPKRKDRAFFYQIPNVIDDIYDLSPYAYRLYGHLRRVIGDREEQGYCNENEKTLAHNCAMSTGSISKAKRELVAKGLIVIDRRKNPNGGKPNDFIFLTDVWKRNKEYFEKKYPLKPLYKAWVEKFGREPNNESEKKYWIQALNDMAEMGITPDELRTGYKAAEARGLDIKSPASITTVTWCENRFPKRH